MDIPDCPAMVMALNGSARLRTASQAFSLGVRGLTSGPVRKRANQFLAGGHFGGVAWAAGLGEMPSCAAPEAGIFAESEAAGEIDGEALQGWVAPAPFCAGGWVWGWVWGFGSSGRGWAGGVGGFCAGAEGGASRSSRRRASAGRRRLVGRTMPLGGLYVTVRSSKRYALTGSRPVRRF